MKKNHYCMRKALGLCVDCGQPAGVGHVRCEICRESQKERERNRRLDMAVGGGRDRSAVLRRKTRLRIEAMLKLTEQIESLKRKIA
jgi:hypothetical protein